MKSTSEETTADRGGRRHRPTHPPDDSRNLAPVGAIGQFDLRQERLDLSGKRDEFGNHGKARCPIAQPGQARQFAADEKGIDAAREVAQSGIMQDEAAEAPPIGAA